MFRVPNLNWEGKTVQIWYQDGGVQFTGFGCQGYGITHWGHFFLGSVVVTDPTMPLGSGQTKTYGPGYAGAGAGAYHSPISEHSPQALQSPVPKDLILDAIWKHLVSKVASSGIVVFSDRVNKSLPASPDFPYPACQFNGHSTSPAAFAKWLHEHPELGTLFSGPIFNNPNYTSRGKYSLVQFYMWHPKAVQMFYDPSSPGKLPDSAQSKDSFHAWFSKTYLDVGAAEAWVGPRNGF